MAEIKVGQKYQIVGDWTTPDNEVVTVSNVSKDLVYTKPAVYSDRGNDEKKHFFPDFRAYEDSGENLGYVLVEEEDNQLSPNEDKVNHPSHYGGDTTYEVIKVAEAWGFDNDAYLFNVLKYIARAEHKGSERQDLEKAKFYLERRISNL